MIIHRYIPHTPHTYGGFYSHHSGQGISSFFRKLFPFLFKRVVRVVTKTAVPAVAKAVKTVGKKALKSAAKHGLKEIAKEGLIEAGKYGVSKAVETIDTLTKKAVSKGLPAKSAHLISDALKKSTYSVANDAAVATANKVNTVLGGLSTGDSSSSKKRKKNVRTQGSSSKKSKKTLASLIEDS